MIHFNNYLDAARYCRNTGLPYSLIKRIAMSSYQVPAVSA